MKHFMTWCEIPVTDMQRAKDFYAQVFDVSFTDEAAGGYQMAMFNAHPEAVSGALIKSDHYVPSREGAVIYLNGGEDLSEPLARAQELGADILWPKTPVKEGDHGYCAQFVDTEGNRVGLYSAA